MIPAHLATVNESSEVKVTTDEQSGIVTSQDQLVIEVEIDDETKPAETPFKLTRALSIPKLEVGKALSRARSALPKLDQLVRTRSAGQRSQVSAQPEQATSLLDTHMNGVEVIMPGKDKMTGWEAFLASNRDKKAVKDHSVVFTQAKSVEQSPHRSMVAVVQESGEIGLVIPVQKLAKTQAREEPAASSSSVPGSPIGPIEEVPLRKVRTLSIHNSESWAATAPPPGLESFVALTGASDENRDDKGQTCPERVEEPGKRDDSAECGDSNDNSVVDSGSNSVCTDETSDSGATDRSEKTSRSFFSLLYRQFCRGTFSHETGLETLNDRSSACESSSWGRGCRVSYDASSCSDGSCHVFPTFNSGFDSIVGRLDCARDDEPKAAK